MAKRLISNQTNLKQKRRFIFLFIGIYLLFITTLSILYFFFYQDVIFLETVLLLMLIGLSIALIWARQAMIPIQMYLHYYRMIDEDLPPFQIQTPIQSKGFQDNLAKYKFQFAFESDAFTIYVRQDDKLPWVVRTQASLIFVVIAKDQTLSITDEHLEQAIIKVKTSIKTKKEIQNELTLIFYQTKQMNANLKEKMHQIINFALQNRAIITIPCLQVGEQNMYALRPKKLFPNKFYYVAIKLLYYLTDANEML